MSDAWREIIYPLGYLSSLIFGMRFLLQWLVSEVHRKSIVTPLFWRLSLVGNLLLMMHGLLQMQYHVCAVQVCNAVISWRNLNLMEKSSSRWSLRAVILLLAGSILTLTLLFIAQGMLLGSGQIEWFRLPSPTGETPLLPVNFFWHLIGFVGLILFSSRFWVQWWCTERDGESRLGLPFWWLSIVGGVLTLVYFIRIDDPVNIIGPAFGLVPYIRNLMLIYKAQQPKISST